LLGPNGYAVVRAHTGRQTLDLARTTHPDAIVIDSRLPEMGGLEVCRMLRDDPMTSAATPVIVTAPAESGRTERLDAFNAGAWDYCTHPVDGEILLLKLASFIRGKREADVLRSDSLLDELTGLYNMRGLARRANEIGAEATRRGEALACVAFTTIADANTPSHVSPELTQRRVAEHVGSLCRRHGRLSDAFGRLGQTEFGVVAPDTDEDGVLRLVERLRSAIEQSPVPVNGHRQTVKVTVGYRAVGNYSNANADAMEMLLSATADLRRPRSSSPSDGALGST
jgi:diguanylate cyclase (GGDEF)-like protein